MAGSHRLRSLTTWASLALAIVIVGGPVALLLLGPSSQPAHGADAAPEVTAGFQTTERLVLTVNLPAVTGDSKRGTLVLELLGPEGEILEQARKDVELNEEVSSQRFEFAAPKLTAEKVSVRCKLDKHEQKVELKKVLLVKAHETTLSAGKEFFTGSDASLRCEVHGVKSLARTVPLAGASVTVRLKGKDGRTFPIYEGKAGADGVADVRFRVPDKAPTGSYKLEVATKSTLGEEKLEQDVQIKSSPRVLLVTDKPLYQPGQLMHIRALALQAFTLHPEAGAPLVFEVEDAKGNKVFKRSQPTSEHGIASVDFQLADEVNNGDYHVRAILREYQADKTVTVKPYVLPKFKSELKADKRYYLPKETIKADLQVDYFFGKPVADGKVKVTASTFDVAFKDFHTWEGKTDAAGHVKFDIKLPDYFVGQPLNKGNALVRLEAKVTDTADHTETITRTYPVSSKPIQVSLIPEGGRLVPEMANHVFAAAVYPDGSPARCDVKIWRGQAAKDEPMATVKTNEAGLAEFTVTPKAGQFRQGPWGQRNVEMLGGQQTQAWGPQQLFDLTVEARDARGDSVTTVYALNSEPFGENVLLRLDRAIYKGGEPMQIDIRSSAGMPTVYLDVVKSGQTLLTKWLDVNEGKAAHKLDLPAGAFGTLEVHVYQTLSSGEIVRDSRVVYVNPAAELKIDIKADKETYTPGEKGTIRFEVTDAAGKPAAAALGVLIVDEAVYALQEMQPGLEKVFFTLQQELLKPQAQAVYKPSERLDDIVRRPVVEDAQQQAARALLAGVRPKPPAHWEVNPVAERRRKIEQQAATIALALWQYSFQQGKSALTKDGKEFRPEVLDDVVKAGLLNAGTLTDPVGGKLTLEELAQLENGFTGERFARGLTTQRMQNLVWGVGNYTTQRQAQWLKGGKWDIPESALAEAAKQHALQASLADAWGRPIKLVKLAKARNYQTGWTQFDQYDLISAGPDGKFGTGDDVSLPPPTRWNHAHVWWFADDSRQAGQAQLAWRRVNINRFGLELADGMPMAAGGAMLGRGLGAAQGAPMVKDGPGGAPRAPMAKTLERSSAKLEKKAGDHGKGGGGGDGGGPAPPRLREYFPETLLWQPALITDEKGRAVLPVDFADSITTWRLSASASSRLGLLGGATKALRVFQDFFVDLDLPVALTQNDEVAFPVAVYNYLKGPQTVKLDLQPEPWFELVDGLGLSRSLDLKANEVTSVKFRIRAKKIGHFPLTVKATGTKMSDAIKRGIDVLPDGKKIEQVVTDRLAGTVKHTIVIPDNAIPDASRLFVKVYPGVFSQVLEGTEGLIRLPGG